MEKLLCNKSMCVPEEPFSLEPDYVKYNCKRACRSPLLWNKVIQKETKNLFREGVIECAPWGITFSFISPTNWVTKDTLKAKFSLVMDLCHLNDTVKKEVSTFPTPSKVLTMLGAFFCHTI